MASYDSDSDSGAEDYTETNVLLGYASKEATDDTTSQLGGHPTWLDSNTPPSGALAKCKVCNNFLTLLLQLDGNLPDRFPGHERRLYLFGCRRKACRRKEGSIRGFRAVRASNVPEPQQQQRKTRSTQAKEEAEAPAPTPAPQKLGESLFGVKPSSASSSGNPFSTGPSSANPFGSSSSPLNPFSSANTLAAKPPQKPHEQQEAQQAVPAAAAAASTPSLSESFASKARISSPEPLAAETKPMGPPEPWPAQSQFTPYPHYYLDADYETLDNTTPALPANARIVDDMDIDGMEDSGKASSSSKDAEDTKAAFESAMDTAFQKFADRLAHNPEQVLRYEFAGQPLLYNKNDVVGKRLAPASSSSSANENVKVQTKSHMPRCDNCGAERLFELQLTPYAIVELEAEELGLEGMEWGTVILGVCAKDCVARGIKAGEVGYVEEWAGVQWEEQVPRK